MTNKAIKQQSNEAKQREFHSRSARATQVFAGKIAEVILAYTRRAHAAVVALSGDLGAGKTTFAQGFARALGVKSKIVSPTFVIFRRYLLVPERGQQAESKDHNNVIPRQAREIYSRYFYHVDAYRIHVAKELATLGFKKILADPKNIVLIEWPKNIHKLLPKDTLMIRLEHGKNASERTIAFREQG